MHIGRRSPLFSVNHRDDYVISSAINKMLKELGSILLQKLENMHSGIYILKIHFFFIWIYKD